MLDAERIKLSTTRSVLWTGAAVAVLSIGLAALQASTAYGAAPGDNRSLVTGTGEEYRFWQVGS